MKSNTSKGKGSRTKDFPAVGSNPLMSAMVGGMGNRTTNPSAKKSGKVDSFCDGGVAGGFKNAGMVNRR